MGVAERMIGLNFPLKGTCSLARRGAFKQRTAQPSARIKPNLFAAGGVTNWARFGVRATNLFFMTFFPFFLSGGFITDRCYWGVTTKPFMVQVAVAVTGEVNMTTSLISASPLAEV